MKLPLDPRPYAPDSRRQPIQTGIADGRYVFVQDERDVIWIVPDDQPHLHPKVLGHGLPAKYAGDLTVKHGIIADVTNCSGTFQFDEEQGLRDIAAALQNMGWTIAPGGVRLFSHVSATRPVILE